MDAVDSARWLRLSPYLDEVLDLPPEEREGWLQSLRASDPGAAAEVGALLAQHRVLSAEGFLDAPVPVPTPEPTLTGVTVGAYTLISPIGHGGMGSVWLAERSDGRFEGRAALKLLNAALMGRAGEERFRREGTILARLTHPHIARLIDAGVSPTGQPYLVLEHIAGRHIDRYCDEETLDVRQRIRLLLDVQAAVAHAHASLIVHRDLKPSNVLVTAAGEVKLLDFGIAKLLESDTESQSTAFVTRGSEIALTPKYAAPEQVTGGPITTATDVYALGVLLFELLTGFHPTGLDAPSPVAFVKAVIEAQPMRLSAAADAASRLETHARAAARGTTPERLRRALRGDLETIVAKALKADPAERYASVAEFGDDLRRYLANQPIAARADSVGYTTAKFVRRHWRPLAAGAATVAILAGLTGFYTTRLARERDHARQQAAKASRVAELLTGLLTVADPYRTPDANAPTVQNLLEIGAQRVSNELAQEPDVQAQMLTVIGRTYERMGQHAKALPLLERALAVGRASLGPSHVVLAQSLNDLGVLHREQGNLAQAEPLLREGLDMRRRLLGAEDPLVAVTLVELARVLQDGGRADEAEPLAREALAIRRKVFGEEHRETATSKSELGLLLLRRGDLAGAEPLLRENAGTTERVLGAGHPNTAAAKSSLASVLLAKGDAKGAEALLLEAAAVNQAVFGPEGTQYAQTLNSLAGALELEDRLDEAQALLEQSLRIAMPKLTDQHPRVLTYMVNLARVQIARGHARDTEELLRHALAAREHLYPAGDWRIGEAQSLLGAALLARARHGEAERMMLAADAALKPVAGPEGRERAANRARLAALYRASGRPREADAFR